MSLIIGSRLRLINFYHSPIRRITALRLRFNLNIKSSFFYGLNYYNNGKHINADLTRDPLICGVEWNIHGSQIDLTFWFSWKDLGSGQWQKHHTTLVLGAWGNQDYWDFYHSFMGEGFSLLINLAQGGDMPQTQEVLVDGQPQHMVVQSAKVYGF